MVWERRAHAFLNMYIIREWGGNLVNIFISHPPHSPLLLCHSHKQTNTHKHTIARSPFLARHSLYPSRRLPRPLSVPHFQCRHTTTKASVSQSVCRRMQPRRHRPCEYARDLDVSVDGILVWLICMVVRFWCCWSRRRQGEGVYRDLGCLDSSSRRP